MHVGQGSRIGRRGHVPSESGSSWTVYVTVLLRLLSGGVTCRARMENSADEVLGCGIGLKSQIGTFPQAMIGLRRTFVHGHGRRDPLLNTNVDLRWKPSSHPPPHCDEQVVLSR